jgi:DNA-binding LytR/AlgR family response regulator
MKTPFKYIIVDDEQHAIDLLSTLMKNFPEFQIGGTFTSSVEAIRFVTINEIDLIFLDIQMPELTGIDFSRKLIELNNNASVIFITAYNEYLLEALHVNAADYLLKPISVYILKEALERYKQRTKKDITESLKKFLESTQRRKLRFNTRNGFITFFEDEILFIKADGVYCNILLQNEKEITVSQNLGKIEEQLQLPELIKIHRSVIVNANFIFEVNKGKKECILELDGKSYKMPISSSGLNLIESITN